MTMPSEAPQLNIRLEVLPERPHVDADVALAMEIRREIFYALKEKYTIEPVDTGAMGFHEFLIFIAPIAWDLIKTAATNLADAATTKFYDTIVEKVTDFGKDMIDKFKQSKRKNVPAEVTVTLPHDQSIQKHGPLLSALENMAVALENYQGQVMQDNHAEGTTEATIEVSMKIKVSTSRTQKNP